MLLTLEPGIVGRHSSDLWRSWPGINLSRPSQVLAQSCASGRHFRDGRHSLINSAIRSVGGVESWWEKVRSQRWQRGKLPVWPTVCQLQDEREREDGAKHSATMDKAGDHAEERSTLHIERWGTLVRWSRRQALHGPQRASGAREHWGTS